MKTWREGGLTRAAVLSVDDVNRVHGVGDDEVDSPPGPGVATVRASGVGAVGVVMVLRVATVIYQRWVLLN
jgi:chemotaxis signal transduction protein